MSLQPPEKIRKLQEALYAKAKQEPEYRFYYWEHEVVDFLHADLRSGMGGQ